eukprot:COSAG05_NODE_1810_length_4040_cov_11.771885_5_plen_215_part_00
MEGGDAFESISENVFLRTRLMCPSMCAVVLHGSGTSRAPCSSAPPPKTSALPLLLRQHTTIEQPILKIPQILKIHQASTLHWSASEGSRPGCWAGGARAATRWRSSRAGGCGCRRGRRATARSLLLRRRRSSWRAVGHWYRLCLDSLLRYCRFCQTSVWKIIGIGIYFQNLEIKFCCSRLASDPIGDVAHLMTWLVSTMHSKMSKLTNEQNKNK